MSRRLNGCTVYTTATLVYTASFPNGNVCCDLCDFCRSENAGTRFRCSLTGEILPFHNKDTGLRCPLDFNNEKETENP